MSRAEKDRRMPTIEAIRSDDVAAAVARGLRRRFGDARSAVKLIARATGFDPRAIKNWWAGVNPPESGKLLQLVREYEEVAEEVDRLSGRADRAEVERLRQIVGELERVLGRVTPGGIA